MCIWKIHSRNLLSFPMQRPVVERERMKHLMASSYNMSTHEATKFGMSNLRKRAEKVVSAAAKISDIKNKHLHFAKIKQKVFLQSIGHNNRWLYIEQ